MLYTVLLKELKQLFSDKGFLLIALIQPIIFIVMFGSSFQQGDINHLNTIVIDEDNSIFSNYVLNATNKSDFFDLVPPTDSLEKALKKLSKSEVRAVIYIPPDFGNNINNTKTGNFKIYIDSSNFLTYSSLSGAKVEIAKETLQKITEDLLGDLEKEKNKSKKKIEDIKEIFEAMETEGDLLDSDLDDLKKELEDTNVSEIERSLDKLQNSLENQKEGLTETEQALNYIINSLSLLYTLNTTEEAKKTAIINQISQIRQEFNDSIKDIKDTIEELTDINIREFNSSEFSEKINNKLDKIDSLFDDVKSKSDEIDMDLGKLQKSFLSEPIILDEVAYQGPIKYFDYLGAGVLSLIIFFVCLMAPALNVISEKEKNTLYRLSTTPASSLTIFLGKFIIFIVFGFIEMLYTLFLAIAIYDLRTTGSIFDVIIILTLLACASISLGLFISSKVKTMQQALVIVPLIVIPSFLISHAFFPPDIMAEFMNKVAYATPMTFSNHALNAIMIKGFSLSEVLTDIYALIGFTLVPLILFIWSYRRIKY